MVKVKIGKSFIKLIFINVSFNFNSSKPLDSISDD